MRSLILLVLLSVALSVIAQGKIYQIVNEDGSISFSDTPSPGAQEIELSSNMTTMQSAPVVAQGSTPQARPNVNYTLSILSPAPEATIRDNDGRVRISAQIQPKTTGKYLLNFAGQQHTSTSGVFMLEGIDRGAHTYSITFSTNRGKVIASTDERTVYLHQASVLIRNSNN